MSEIYYRHWKKMNNWHRVKMWTEKKLLKPHKFFGIFKLYDMNGSGAYGMDNDKPDKNLDARIKKFLTKYPHAENFTMLDPSDPENYYQQNKNPVVQQTLTKTSLCGIWDIWGMFQKQKQNQ